MNLKTSRRFIALGTLAVVLAAGVVAFTVSSKFDSTAVKSPVPPMVGAAADAAPAMTNPLVAAADSGATLPELTTEVARDGSVSAESAVRSPPTTLSPAPVSAPLHQRTVESASHKSQATAGSESVEGSLPETFANRSKRQGSSEPAATQVAARESALDDVTTVSSMVYGASDVQITTDVKSAIAADISVKEFDINVSTSEGVVTLTGRVATQGAIDQARGVAAKIKDVRRVDTSALILASL
jgi:hyperosmotically inducible protein